ncbi:MAG: cytochrome c family protein [Sandaracinaceae bacterium]|nr:cytochrome c family protein [Sandaracinaceae bacterium]
MDVETCGTCHGDVLASWRSSAHARSSMDNPWYRQAVDAFRAHAGNEQGRFCAGCHDPVLLVAGAVDSEITPDDPRAHAGITCLVCHGMSEVRPDGSASFTLSTRAVHLPDPGDPRSVEEHVRAVTPDELRTSQLCGSCHRGFLGPDMGNAQHLDAVDELSAWSRSAYAGSNATRVDEPLEEATCQGCHMPERDARLGDLAADGYGRIRVHRFMGAHTTMADAARDGAQPPARHTPSPPPRPPVGARGGAGPRGRRGARGRGGGAWSPARAPRRAGDTVELDVVVHNAGTGHRFPGGTIDTHDTWIEVEVRDAGGRLVAEAGTRHARQDDPEAHLLRAVLVDPSADPEYRHHVQRFGAKITDHTLAPRDAEVARYLLEVPDAARMPLSVRARLRHRRHNRVLVASACAAQRSARGRAFVETSRRLGNRPLDACRPQPITELAEARVWIGPGSEERASRGGASAPRWRRLFDHAMGLVQNVQESLDEARPSLEAALEAAPTRERAPWCWRSARARGQAGPAGGGPRRSRSRRGPHRRAPGHRAAARRCVRAGVALARRRARLPRGLSRGPARRHPLDGPRARPRQRGRRPRGAGSRAPRPRAPAARRVAAPHTVPRPRGARPRGRRAGPRRLRRAPHARRHRRPAPALRPGARVVRGGAPAGARAPPARRAMTRGRSSRARRLPAARARASPARPRAIP